MHRIISFKLDETNCLQHSRTERIQEGEMRREKMKRKNRILAMLLTAMLCIALLPVQAFAVTGSTVAADGVYSGYSSEGTVSVTVSNGKISKVSANVKSKYQSYISSAFSSVIGKSATANNIDAVSAATKHMSAIKSGAKSALASAPAADGSDIGSGSGSGTGSGSGSGSTTETTEFTIETGGTQTLQVSEDTNYTYKWSSSDTSKVTVSGTGAKATVTGKAVTTSPVTVTCTYYVSVLPGITVDKEYVFNVVPSDNEEIGKGIGSKTGTKYTGKAYVNGDEEDEWVELDVYVDNGKISGIFIAAEDGSWLNLLTSLKDQFLGKDGTTTTEVDAVTSATTLGFRDTIRNAISNALGGVQEEKPKAPELTSGDGSSWTKGTGGSLSFTSDAEYDTFKNVKVDGSTVTSSNYTVKSGSTIVELKSSYLETLSAGSHSIAIVSENGTASGTFTVTAAADSGSGSGTGSSGGTYTGTIVSSLTDGDYIIADRYSASYSYYALSNSTAGNSGGGYGYTGEDVTISGDTATVTTNKAVWTWNSSNKSFYNAALGKYLALPSDKYTESAFFSNSPVALTFYTVSGNEATVYNPSGSGGYYLNAAYPSSGKAFSSNYAGYVNQNYLKSGSGVYFYKIQESTEKAAKITLNPTSLSLKLGGTGTVAATVEGCAISAVSSSNEDVAVATVSGNTITVSGKAAGTAVFTVTGKASSGYTSPESVTFTVTVASGSTGGSGTGGGTTTTTPGNPTYVKSISPKNTVSDNYTISLNVTADDMESTTTTPGTSAKGTNLAIVVDISGSIVGKESALNAAIQSLVQGLPESSQVGVVTFNERASMSSVYTPSTISGLSFSGVQNAGTNMATGISAATSLLNGSGWENKSNKKAMVIISDFVIDDYTNSINNAKTAKDAGTTIYAVKVDSESVGAATRIELNTDNKADSAISAARYISSQYPEASAVAGGGMFASIYNIAEVTPGESDKNAAYVYGAAGGNWSDVFAEIKASEGITEESTEQMKNVVITDTLSDYVELTGSAPAYGVTLDTTDTSVSIDKVTVDGKTVSVALKGELIDGTTYTVNIPVKPTEQAQMEANQKFAATTNFKSNASATMSYEYDADHKDSVTYKETPEIVVAKKVKLTYDANVSDAGEVSGMPTPAEEENAVASDGKATFTVTSNKPTRNGYTFLGWNTDKGASEADTDYAAGNNVSIETDTTVYAIWQHMNVTITFNANGGTGTMDAQIGEYGEDIILRANAFKKEGYTFAGWKVIAVTDPPSKIARLFSPKARAKAVMNEEFEDKATIEGLTQDITLEAQWKPIEYKITYNLDGGSVTGTNPKTYTIESDDITLINPTRDGYTFAGWTGTDLTNASNNVTIANGSTGDRTYTATWTQNEHKVTYKVTGDVLAGYSVPAETTQKTGASVTVEAAGTTNRTEKDGVPGTWAFEGWIAPEDLIVTEGSFTMPDKDVEFTGSWTFTPNTYTVTYTDGVDGEEVFADQTKDNLAYNADTPAFGGTPSRDGYTFKGWSPEPTEKVTATVTYEAQWEKVQDSKNYTVDTKVQKHTYEIYQIFTGDYTEMTEGEGEDQTKKDVLTNIVWGQNGKGKTGDKVDGKTLKKLYDVVDKPLDDDKLAEIEKIVDLKNPIKTIDTDNDTTDPISVNLPAGYYLIKDKDGTQTGKNDAYTTYITVVVKDYTVQPKSVLPTVDKQVFDDSASDATDKTSTDNASNKNPGSGWYESADHAINQTFQFKLTATIPAPGDGEYNRFDDYETYQLIFHDTMSQGVTFDSIESVTVGDKTIPVKSDSDQNGYTITAITSGEDGAQAWSLTIPDLKKYNDMKSGATVTVIYNAHLNEKAITHNESAESTDTNKNSVYLEYSNNPNTGHSADLGKTSSDTVWVFTYQVNNTKVDASNNNAPLAGAGFRLYTSDGQTEIPVQYNATAGGYIPVTSGGEEMKSAESTGTFNIVGLDAGEYTLKESSVPAGYNQCEDVKIIIGATHKETDDTTKAGLTLTNDSTMSNTIENRSGSVLPSTGGMGTRLLYIIGAIFVLGAGVLLVARRKMQA